MHKQGLTVSMIANQRGLNENTIYSHLSSLYAGGEDIDIYKFVTESELGLVIDFAKRMEPPITLRPIFEAFEEKISYTKIKFALAHFEREVKG